MKHTETPWKLTDCPGDIDDKDGELLACTHTMDDGITAAQNAAFIVRACNSHYQLVAALKEMMSAYEQCLPDHCNAGWFDDYNRAVAALAAAGEQS